MNNVESVERLAKLVKRLNPDQFVSVDVESLVHLLTAHKMLEKLPDAVKQQYSIASELDADKWDAEWAAILAQPSGQDVKHGRE